MISDSLSVVIPAYMAESTIASAVDSAFSAGASEVIVVDDGSTDDTHVVAVAAGATCLRQANTGAAGARVAGAEHVRTDYLVFLDADDRLIADGVRRSVDFLRLHQRVAVSAGTVVGVGRGGKTRHFPIRFSPVTTASLLTQGFGPWPPCAAVIRTSAYRASQRLSQKPLNPAFAEDYEMLIRLSMIGEIDVRDDPTCYYAVYGGKSEKSALLAIQAKEEIRQYYSRTLQIKISPLSGKQMQMAADVRRARAAFAAGHLVETSRLLLKWVSRDPAQAARKLTSQPWKRN